MGEIILKGINDGKPIEVEEINARATTELDKVRKWAKETQVGETSPEMITRMAYVALLSTNSLMDVPIAKLARWSEMIKLEDATRLIAAFAEVNDFLPKEELAKMKNLKLMMEPVLQSPTPSQSSPVGASSIQASSSSPTA